MWESPQDRAGIKESFKPTGSIARGGASNTNVLKKPPPQKNNTTTTKTTTSWSTPGIGFSLAAVEPEE